MLTTKDCRRALTTDQAIDAIYPTSIVINLSGPEGNIFYIQGVCKQVMRELRLDMAERNKFTQELEGKTYKERLQIMTKWFGFIFIGIE